MFTGIIQEIGKITRTGYQSSGKQIILECSNVQSDMKLGDSLACNGICLTVAGFDRRTVTLEAMAETIERTTLKDWKTGDNVNLERALKADSRLDGHLVQGHIDTVAGVISSIKQDRSLLLEIELPVAFRNLVVEKGSIAVNGVSLTIAKLTVNSFKVALVGFTIQNTNLSSLRSGSKVNLEFDIIGKYLKRYLDCKPGHITEEMLRD